jgi:hypothetical protein
MNWPAVWSTILAAPAALWRIITGTLWGVLFALVLVLLILSAPVAWLFAAWWLPLTFLAVAVLMIGYRYLTRRDAP